MLKGKSLNKFPDVEKIKNQRTTPCRFCQIDDPPHGHRPATSRPDPWPPPASRPPATASHQLARPLANPNLDHRLTARFRLLYLEWRAFSRSSTIIPPRTTHSHMYTLDWCLVHTIVLEARPIRPPVGPPMFSKSKKKNRYI
jgi:hypothetical protein